MGRIRCPPLPLPLPPPSRPPTVKQLGGSGYYTFLGDRYCCICNMFGNHMLGGFSLQVAMSTYVLSCFLVCFVPSVYIYIRDRLRLLVKEVPQPQHTSAQNIITDLKPFIYLCFYVCVCPLRVTFYRRGMETSSQKGFPNLNIPQTPNIFHILNHL